MEPERVVQAFYDVLNTSGPEAAEAYLAGDYVLEQPGAPVQGREQWLAFQRMWRAGFPDLVITYELHDVEDNVVRGTSRATGTHSADLDLGLLGKAVVPPSGKVLTITQTVAYVVECDQIVSAVSQPDAGSGIPGLLVQLGVDTS
jgi:hypothetical protein